MSEPRRLLFVCYANLIRSPLAENLFRRLAGEAGLADRFEIDSAGTGVGWAGEPPHAQMARLAAERGLALEGVSRRIRRDDFQRFDWILAADADVQDDLLAIASSPRDRAKVRQLREFDPMAQPGEEVPDPVSQGPAGFARTYEIIERSVRGLFEAFQAGEL